MEYPRIMQIKIGGEIEADDFADELAEKCNTKDILIDTYFEEIDIKIRIQLETYEDFVIVDNFLAGLVQEYIGKVTLEVE